MRVAYLIASAASLVAALPTEQIQPQNHLRLPRQTNLNDNQNPPIVIPDTPRGAELATDPLTGYKGFISNGFTRLVEGATWLAEVLAVFRGERDENRGGSPAAGNGA